MYRATLTLESGGTNVVYLNYPTIKQAQAELDGHFQRATILSIVKVEYCDI